MDARAGGAGHGRHPFQQRGCGVRASGADRCCRADGEQGSDGSERVPAVLLQHGQQVQRLRRVACEELLEEHRGSERPRVPSAPAEQRCCLGASTGREPQHGQAGVHGGSAQAAAHAGGQGSASQLLLDPQRLAGRVAGPRPGGDLFGDGLQG